MIDGGEAARRLVRCCGHAALATALDGRPYVSLVAVACALDATPLLMLSDLARHTQNLAADPRVSLLFVETPAVPEPLAAPRLTLLGRAERCDDPLLAARFAARHPESAGYAGFADFRLYRVAVERAHLIAGFGRIAWVAGDALRFGDDTTALAAAESGIIAQMNADHADALACYAERLLGRTGSGWHMTGIDPEGIDLRSAAREAARLDFAAPVLNPRAARETLLTLAAAARPASSAAR